MVSTRHHPRAFPEPSSPTPRSTRGTPSKASSSPRTSPPTSPVMSAFESVTNAVSSAVTPAKTTTTRTSTRRRKSKSTAGTYAHVVDPIVIVWIFVSVPLVIWDCGYVLLRPLSMPGGSLHAPIWSPYELYGTVDYIYGWPAYNDGVGWTSAQGSLNVLESLMYGFYIYVLASQGEGTGWWKFWEKEFWTEKMVVQGEGVALATLLCLSSAIMTVSKTVLYWLNEYFSKFENIGHNSAVRLFWLWIVPNGLWLVFPSYMTYVLGREIVAAMHVAKSSGLEKED